MAIDLVGFNQLAGVEEDPDQSFLDGLRYDDALDIPHQLTDIDMWNNYCDDRLYLLDKEVREFVTSTKYTRQTKGHMKTAVPLVFAFIFGRSPQPEDSQVCVMLHRLLEYYCTRYTGSTKLGNKRVSRAYYFSRYAMNSKRPMSIRLRLEEKNDQWSLREYGTNQVKGPKPR